MADVPVSTTRSIAEFLIFVAFNRYFLDSDSPHESLLADGDLFQGGAYMLQIILRVGAYTRGLIESLRYPCSLWCRIVVICLPILIPIPKIFICHYISSCSSRLKA